MKNLYFYFDFLSVCPKLIYRNYFSKDINLLPISGIFFIFFRQNYTQKLLEKVQLFGFLKFRFSDFFSQMKYYSFFLFSAQNYISVFRKKKTHFYKCFFCFKKSIKNAIIGIYSLLFCPYLHYSQV